MCVFIFWFVEKGEPRAAGRGEAQHPGQEDPGGEDEEADAERGVLEEERRGGALEDGDEVWLKEGHEVLSWGLTLKLHDHR